MIRIDRMQLRLPPGFEHRAQSITRQLGKVLGRQPEPQSVSIDALSVSPRRIQGNLSDDDIAELIAKEIIAAYRGGQT